MKTLWILQHLGLGDHLICNGLVRFYASRYPSVFLFCWSRNLSSVQFVFRDLSNISIVPIKDLKEAEDLIKTAIDRHDEVLRLGVFSSKKFDATKWTEEFYRHAGLSPQIRWNDFHFQRDLSTEFVPPSDKYIFLHDDPTRNLTIDRTRINFQGLIIQPDPQHSNNIFQWCQTILNATEIHCIDSCFAVLVDFMKENPQAERLVLHLYCRNTPVSFIPSRRNWEILT